jgi:DNA-binding Xre family transcriptional regulator
MIQLRIKELLIQKGLRPTAFSLTKFGIPRVSAQQMLNAKAKSISFIHLERLCIGLRCTPKEILRVYSTETLPIPPDAPLFAWVGYELPFPLADFRNLTPDQLAKASEFMRNMIDGVEQ